MKASQNQIILVCNSFLGSGSNIGAARLTVDRVRSAVEGGHIALGSVKYDSPKQADLQSAISAAVEAYASRLTVDGSEQKDIADNLKTTARKDGTIYIQRNRRADMGTARPAVAWLFTLRTYANEVRKSGNVNAKTRKSLVVEFGKLTKSDFACLNVSDKESEGGMGIVRAKSIVADFKTAESGWQTQFRISLNDSTLELAKAKAVAKGEKAMAIKPKAVRKAYTLASKAIPSALSVAPMVPVAS